MPKIPIAQVDAFTDTPLTGNPAGVVGQADGLTETQMQAIAREMAVSETAFVLRPKKPGADLAIRWFTPANEVPLCGHATVGAFHALAEEGKHGMRLPGSFPFRVETRSGVLPVTVEKEPRRITVRFGLPVPEFQRAGQHKLEMMHLLGVQPEDLESHLPIVGADYLYVPIRRLHALFELRPNLPGLAQFLVNRGYGGLCVFVTETVERTSAVHSRFFAPHQGIDEDPVTGSANGPLGAYLFEQRIAEPRDGVLEVIGEQGDAIGRPGRVKIRVGVEGDHVTSVEIAGRAVTVLRGNMHI
jgi:PhzF family phenazine biosynthesis protein